MADGEEGRVVTLPDGVEQAKGRLLPRGVLPHALREVRHPVVPERVDVAGAPRPHVERVARAGGVGQHAGAAHVEGEHPYAEAGALELAACVEMMRAGILLPTRNLENVDPACASVRLLREPEARPVRALLKNSFALGGVNASILLRRYPQ